MSNPYTWSYNAGMNRNTSASRLEALENKFPIYTSQKPPMEVGREQDHLMRIDMELRKKEAVRAQQHHDSILYTMDSIKNDAAHAMLEDGARLLMEAKSMQILKIVNEKNAEEATIEK